MQFQFIADEPISRTELDTLGFGGFVERIHAALAATRDPFVYGLLGPWGSGKTSVQRLLLEKFATALQDAKKGSAPVYVPIWLDAWRYENQDNMIFPLLHAFRESRAALLGEQETEPGKKGFLEHLRVVAYASTVAAVDLGLRAATKKLVGEAIKLEDVTKRAEEAIKAIDADTQKDKDRAEVEAALDAWIKEVDGLSTQYRTFIASYAAEVEAARGLDEGQVRFVIFIDDLDRCLPNVAVGLLEAIKNHLSVKRCIYILAINPDVIARGIRAKYAGLEVSGREYLEKILHYSFAVPVPDTEKLKEFGVKSLEARLNGAVADLEMKGWFQSFGATLAEANFSNPRKIKRILNSYLRFLQAHGEIGENHVRLFDLGTVTKLIILAEYHSELFSAGLGAIEHLRRLLRDNSSPDHTADKFRSTYGLAADALASELSRTSFLLQLSTLEMQGARTVAQTYAAVRDICGHV